MGDLTHTRGLYVGALEQTRADIDNFVASIQQYQPRVTSPQQTSLIGADGGQVGRAVAGPKPRRIPAQCIDDPDHVVAGG
ncbi:hypothetical protein SAMN05421759_104357 [Roseivivax lentus]|uniref:Uncharacterized protein n=1 Tax=Roseivivax lentus TaxID=633194 RepID=A0A1N7MIA8_9RHOB|nr:hypothetical protein [Roseivivax lentus]SIS85865.1 hypothetical protein SAMN05421759_104357 [Roseivivax lentus]